VTDEPREPDLSAEQARDPAEPLRVGVLGARGRMGTEVCRAVDAADDLELVAMIDQGDWLSNASDAGAEVVVDFTTPDVVMDNLHWCIEQGLNVVVGTSGFTPQRLERVRGWLAHKPELGVIIAPNFAVGAVLMMRFAVEASRLMERAEVIELHHHAKLDAPSGTAARTAELMDGEVPIHSVRLPGIVADQDVILGDVGQTLTISHRTVDRTSFMPGVVLAIRRVADLPESPTIGLEHLLFPE
jgi:4-hydroxy-tetrahydrodipicolinate reductase